MLPNALRALDAATLARSPARRLRDHAASSCLAAAGFSSPLAQEQLRRLPG